MQKERTLLLGITTKTIARHSNKEALARFSKACNPLTPPELGQELIPGVDD